MGGNASDWVRAVVAGVLAVDLERVTPEARFVDDLGADSLALIEMLMHLEEVLGTALSEDEVGQLERVDTVGKAVAFVEAHRPR